MKKIILKVVGITVCLACIFLCACGGEGGGGTDYSQEPIVGSYYVAFAMDFSGNYITTSSTIEFKDDGTFDMTVDGVDYSGNWEPNGETDSSIDVSRNGYDMKQQGEVLSTAWYTDKESGKGYEVIIPFKNGATGMYFFCERTE